jgi:hypothetical protein
MSREQLLYEMASAARQQQRASHESLRNRAIATVTAAAIVFSILQGPVGGHSHFDGWALGALIAFITLGGTAIFVLAPMPVFVPVLKLQNDIDEAMTVGRSIASKSRGPGKSIPPSEALLCLQWANTLTTESRKEATIYGRLQLVYEGVLALFIAQVTLLAASAADDWRYQVVIVLVGGFLLMLFVGIRAQHDVRLIVDRGDLAFFGQLFLWLKKTTLPFRALRFILVRLLRLPNPNNAVIGVPNVDDHVVFLTELGTETIEETDEPREALEKALQLPSDFPGKSENVGEAFVKSSLFALGYPAGDVSADQGTESDLLHFTIEAGGHDRVLLPVFTRLKFVRDALLKNEPWQSLSVLEVDGKDLLPNIDDDVAIVINPWTTMEFVVPKAQTVSHGRGTGET